MTFANDDRRTPVCKVLMNEMKKRSLTTKHLGSAPPTVGGEGGVKGSVNTFIKRLWFTLIIPLSTLN